MKIELGKPTMKDYYTPTECTWCDGCGDYGIWSAIRLACVANEYQSRDVLGCFDIGCHGNMSDKIGGIFRLHGLHGRAIPIACGAKLANPNVNVFACGGDGATFSEGINHLIHAVRSNYPVVFILHNNENYGLTTGQASSVTRQGTPMNTSPNGIPEATLSPMDLVFSLQPTFVARGHSGDIKQLTHLIQEGFKHDGFAYIDVLQACPSYNKFLTSKYLRDHCYSVDEKYDPTDFEVARKTAKDTTERIATGILYRERDPRPSFLGRLKPREGKNTTCAEEVKKVDITELMREFV